MRTLTIILDTNEYIFGLIEKDQNCKELLESLANFRVLIPRIILSELHNNLGGELLSKLYRLLIDNNIEIVDAKIPHHIVEKFKGKLPFEDAIIVAYCELLEVDYLISENRHFLVGFNPVKFKVLPAREFLKRYAR